jgi:ribosomal protein S18 acetylase RimI-like enzyme
MTAACPDAGVAIPTTALSKGTNGVNVRIYQETDFGGIERLWEQVFPNDPLWNQAQFAIPEKLAAQPELLLVAEDEGQIVGSVMAGYDGHRGWLYSVAVAPSHQGTGAGAKLVGEAEQRLKSLGCSKVNLQVRSTNEAVIGFYRRLGYQIEDRVSMGKRISD